MQEAVMPKWVGYTFITVLVAVMGLALWFPAHRLVLRVSAMLAEHSWKQADAIITSRLMISEAAKHGKQWTPAWKYSYAVNGVSYTGEGPDKSYSFQALWYPTEIIAEQASLVRPVGMRVRVYYDLRDPGHSVLDRPTWGFSDWLDVMLLLFILAVIRDARRKGRKQ